VRYSNICSQGVAPKGIAMAVVIFLLSTYDIPGINTILDYGLVFILYSIILATAVIKFSKFFIQVELIKPTAAGQPAKPSPSKKHSSKKSKKSKKKK